MQHKALLTLLVLAFAHLRFCTAGGLTPTSIKTIADVGKAYTSTSSCSSASVESYGGTAIAYSQSNSKAIAEAANACAKAVTAAFNAAGPGCSQADVSTTISAAAIACTTTSITLRTSALATALSAGRGSALASACGYAAACSQAYAKAIASAVGGAVAPACDAYTSSTGETKVTAIATSLTKGLAGNFAYAATFGTGTSKATASALFTADAAVYAKAIGELVAYGCSNCAAAKACSYCAKGIQDGDSTFTESVAVAAKGRLALSSAFSDAVSAVCQKAITVEAATQGCLQAIGEVCIQIAAKATGWVGASGNAVACTSSYSTGSAYGLSEAFGSLVSEATALAFRMDTCAASAFSRVTADVFVNVTATEVVKAVQSACVASNGGSVTYSAIATALKLSDNAQYAKAINDAIASVVSSCECSGDGYCCNCAVKNPLCSY